MKLGTKNLFFKEYNETGRMNFHIYLRFGDSYKVIAFPLRTQAVA